MAPEASARRPGLSGPKRVAFAGVVLLAALALAAAVGELGLRVAGSPFASMLVDFYARDDHGNLRLIPGVRRHLADFCDVEVDVGPDGFRRSPAPAAGGTAAPRTVVAVGDSFTFGWGVGSDEAFPGWLAARLPAGVRVLNRGVPSTGPADYERLVETVVLPGDPEAVIVSVWVGNDFHDEASGGSDAYEVIEGYLVPIGDGPPGLRHRLIVGLKTRSALAQSLALRWWSFRDRFLAAGAERAGPASSPRRYVEVHLADPPPAIVEAEAAVLRRLQAIADRCRERGVALVVHVMPRSWQVHAADRASMMQAFGLRKADLDLDRPQRVLREWARRPENHQVRFVDVLPSMREAARAAEARGEELRFFFRTNAHYDVAGHAHSGRELLPVVQGALSVAAPETPIAPAEGGGATSPAGERGPGSAGA